MRQKILHKSSSPQPGSEIGLGEFQNSETSHQTGSGRVHPPSAHQACQMCGCDCRDDKTPEETEYAPGPGVISRIATALPLLLIWLYQATLSPYIGQCCRFTPSCSRYSAEAFKIHGFWKGLYLTIKRLWRCQPCYPGGYDPVPPRHIKRKN